MKILRYILLLFTVGLTACFEDMNVEPGDPNVYLAEDFYSSAEAYKQGLAGVYGNLSLTGTNGAAESNIQGLDAGTSQYGRGLWNLQVLSTDEAVWTWEGDPGLRGFNRTDWTAENVVIRGMFGRTMTSVAFANEFLRQSTDEILSERGLAEALAGEVEMYRAEARFLRALSYYHMMDLFGKAAFITENDVVGAYQAPQYDRVQLFEYVESELLAILDDMADPMQNEYARADKAAAWMLLAKLYLNAEVFIGENRYADCLQYCEQIIAAGFTLNPSYLNNFRADNDQGDARAEIIFPVVSDGIVTQNYGPTTVCVNGQVGSVESNGESFGVAATGWGGALRVPQEFSEIMLNGSYGTDDRNTLLTADRTMSVSSIQNQATGYVIQKWSNLTSAGERGSANEIVDTDFPMFRLADVHLMYAEVHLRGGGGDINTATQYINALRTRSNNPNQVSAGDLTLDLILNERLVELHWEGHRRQDLIRFGSFSGSTYNWEWKGNTPGGIGIPEYRNLYPIPSQSLASNLNLEQNPGY